MHSPFFRTKSDGEPAELTSIFFNDTILVLVAPYVSDDRTANPSIAELSNKGEGNLALTFFAKVFSEDSLKSMISGFN